MLIAQWCQEFRLMFCIFKCTRGLIIGKFCTTPSIILLEDSLPYVLQLGSQVYGRLYITLTLGKSWWISWLMTPCMHMHAWGSRIHQQTIRDRISRNCHASSCLLLFCPRYAHIFWNFGIVLRMLLWAIWSKSCSQVPRNKYVITQPFLQQTNTPFMLLWLVRMWNSTRNCAAISYITLRISQGHLV
jgi:hypothetical protein